MNTENFSPDRPHIPRRIVSRGEFVRGTKCDIYAGEVDGLEPSLLPAFCSNGGPRRHHPDQNNPFSFECRPEPVSGMLKRVSLVGIFALHASGDIESPGALGASIQFYLGTDLKFCFNLVNGKNYFDARDLEPIHNSRGDGSSIETLDIVNYDGEPTRIDLLTIDIPAGIQFDSLIFKDLGSPASFVIFDLFFEYQAEAACPFHSLGGGVPLNELGAIIRTGDRLRYFKAIQQLENSIRRASDLDEARGQALTFLSVVTAATLEMGGPRTMIKVGLEAARALDKLQDKGQITHEIQVILESIVSSYFNVSDQNEDLLIDRVLAILHRTYAKRLSDDTMADELGLSTSHFRFLFKKATGVPFHKYLTAMRLERAKYLLLEGDLPVHEVASSVGFMRQSHFSRAFSTRFKVNPNALRRPGAVNHTNEELQMSSSA